MSRTILFICIPILILALESCKNDAVEQQIIEFQSSSFCPNFETPEGGLSWLQNTCCDPITGCSRDPIAIDGSSLQYSFSSPNTVEKESVNKFRNYQVTLGPNGEPFLLSFDYEFPNYFGGFVLNLHQSFSGLGPENEDHLPPTRIVILRHGDWVGMEIFTTSADEPRAPFMARIRGINLPADEYAEGSFEITSDDILFNGQSVLNHPKLFFDQNTNSESILNVVTELTFKLESVASTVSNIRLEGFGR